MLLGGLGSVGAGVTLVYIGQFDRAANVEGYRLLGLQPMSDQPVVQLDDAHHLGLGIDLEISGLSARLVQRENMHKFLEERVRLIVREDADAMEHDRVRHRTPDIGGYEAVIEDGILPDLVPLGERVELHIFLPHCRPRCRHSTASLWCCAAARRFPASIAFGEQFEWQGAHLRRRAAPPLVERCRLDGAHFLEIERRRRLAAEDCHRPFVQFDFVRTIHWPLRLRDKGIEVRLQRREPFRRADCRLRRDVAASSLFGATTVVA